MTEFILIIEILIDRLLLYLPSELFVKAPFFSVFLADPNGRYVLSGVAVIAGLIGLWVFLSIFQLLLVSLVMKIKQQRAQNRSGPARQKTEFASDEFQFFKRKGARVAVVISDDALRSVEQEMLAIRKKFADGLILKDVYVSETQRLYIKANKFKLQHK